MKENQKIEEKQKIKKPNINIVFLKNNTIVKEIEVCVSKDNENFYYVVPSYSISGKEVDTIAVDFFNNYNEEEKYSILSHMKDIFK